MAVIPTSGLCAYLETPIQPSVRVDDYAADVDAWTAAIRRQTGAPCVWVLGHSEGGLVALAAAQKATDICGLVLVSTAGQADR
jgi:uncharacterized protein